MTNEQILERQVEALEKLLQLRQAIIEELESKVNKLEADKINPPYTNIPYVPYWQQPQMYPGIGIGGAVGAGGTITVSSNCPDGSPHQYPTAWTSNTTPHCTKCGQMIYGSAGAISGIYGGGNYSGGITHTSTVSNNANLPVHTSGYVAPVAPVATGAIGSDDTYDSQNNVFTLTNLAK